MQRLLRYAALLLFFTSGSISAAEIRVLSCNGMEAGLEAAARGFRNASGHGVRIAYTPPQRIEEKLSSAEIPGMVIASLPMIDAFTRAGKLAGAPVLLGRIGIGMATRPGPPLPVVTDAEGLRRAVTQAPSLVFNRSATGNYLDGLFERMRLTPTVTSKALRFPTTADVFEHLLRGSGDELGFGAITEIRMMRELRYLGPLPPELQSYTTYGAALMPGAPAAAEAMLRWLAGAEARAAFDNAGMEPPP
jgi:molybdate transport system substrate-binding protein